MRHQSQEQLKKTRLAIAESVIKNLFLQNKLPSVIEIAIKNHINEKEFARICESAIPIK